MYLVVYTASLHIPLWALACLFVVVLRIIKNLPEHHIHYVLQQTWILKPGPNDTDHKPQSTMYGFVVPSLYIRMLAMYIAFMLSCVAGTFWYEFLLEETIQHSCNPSGVDCFFIKHFWNILKFAEPLDCHHVPIGVSTVTCYKYKFDINGASWTAGRVFGICTTIIKALPACFLFLKRCVAQRNKTMRYPIILLHLLLISVTGFLVHLLIILVLVRLVPFILLVPDLLSFSYFLELTSISSGILLSLGFYFLILD